MNEVLWAATRATALVSLVLLTGTFVIGVLTSGRAATSAVTHTVLTRVHRTLSLLMTLFIAGHVVTAIAETYVDIDWISAVVPFTAGYQRVWTGLGAIAVDLILAIVATSLLMPRLPVRAWRAVHVASYALWPITLAHAVGSVSVDVTLTWIVVAACTLAGVAAVGVRLLQVPADTRQRERLAHGWRVEEGANR